MHFIEVRIAGKEYRFESDSLEAFKFVGKVIANWIASATEEES